MSEAKLEKAPRTDKGDEDIGNVVRGACDSIFANPDKATTKRIAWAYGCSKKDSEDEAKLLAILRERIL
jgi:hypothetical protein